MTAAKRLSQAISEGDGISLIVAVDGPDAARAAEAGGADAVVLYEHDEARLDEVSQATTLPVVFYFEEGRAGAVRGADACVVHGDTEWLEQVHGELTQAVEVAIRIDEDEQLEDVLVRFDPEILVLGSGDGRLDDVLALLSDVPAGKLAVAELGDAARAEIEELERAGCDAVLVRAAHPAA